MVAILRQEPAGETCLRTLLGAPVARISAASYLETATVLAHVPVRQLAAELDELIADANIIIEPFTAQQAQLAREAHRRFGRGSGHRAHLNFGDCFAYALAKALDEPLLFIGNDFVHTDLRPALASA